MRRPVLIACVALGSVGCGRQALPVAPSVPAQPLPISVEAEAGSGEGDLMRRLNASGGSTIHLAPGQRRRLTFTTSAQAAEYALMVRYSNDNPGDTETLRLELDGVSLGSFRAQDTGDDGVGWEIFVADSAGTSMVQPGSHAVVVQSLGGDGCIEIDLVAVNPVGR